MYVQKLELAQLTLEEKGGKNESEVTEVGNCRERPCTSQIDNITL
jgi:hypothetical protein